MISNSLPQKELDSSSMNSTPIEKEPVMECPLLLTTLSGVTFKVSLSVAKFDRFTDLEDQVMDYLASVTDLQVFGWVGGWGPRYLAQKRERGPARVPRLLGGFWRFLVVCRSLRPGTMNGHGYVTLPSRPVGMSLVTWTCLLVLRGRQATAPSTPVKV